MAAQVFWALFYSNQWPSRIDPTADFDGAAILPPIFFMTLATDYGRLERGYFQKFKTFGLGQTNWAEIF